MSSVIKKRLHELERKRTTTGGYTFQEMHKITCPVIRASFKALYEPRGGKV